jgi:hypothetical protein
MIADEAGVVLLLSRDEAQEITMDDNMGAEPETPESTLPILTGAALPEFLESKDSALANALQRLVHTNDEDQHCAVFASAVAGGDDQEEGGSMSHSARMPRLTSINSG